MTNTEIALEAALGWNPAPPLYVATMLCTFSTLEEKLQVACPLFTAADVQPLTSVPAVLSWNVTVPVVTVDVDDTVAVRVAVLPGAAVKIVDLSVDSDVDVFAPAPAVVIDSVQDAIVLPVLAWFVTYSLQVPFGPPVPLLAPVKPPNTVVNVPCPLLVFVLPFPTLSGSARWQLGGPEQVPGPGDGNTLGRNPLNQFVVGR